MYFTLNFPLNILQYYGRPVTVNEITWTHDKVYTLFMFSSLLSNLLFIFHNLMGQLVLWGLNEKLPP